MTSIDSDMVDSFSFIIAKEKIHGYAAAVRKARANIRPLDILIPLDLFPNIFSFLI